jgi:hypothetical protein
MSAVLQVQEYLHQVGPIMFIVIRKILTIYSRSISFFGGGGAGQTGFSGIPGGGGGLPLPTRPLNAALVTGKQDLHTCKAYKVISL